MSHFSCSDRLKFQKRTSCHDMSSYHDIKLFDIGYKIMTVCHGTPACVMLGFHLLMRYTVSTVSCFGPPNVVQFMCDYHLYCGRRGKRISIFAVLNFLKENFQHVLEKKRPSGSHIVDREIFTLKIIRVKSFCVVKFSQFRLI